mmetsp:Transcript_31678/g.81165  ORF Transcript_31678/g.81165 Transcript_31678/m.81165 type:complete len:355 (+) Transcript_31678:1088-2152(+)
MHPVVLEILHLLQHILWRLKHAVKGILLAPGGACRQRMRCGDARNRRGSKRSAVHDARHVAKRHARLEGRCQGGSRKGGGVGQACHAGLAVLRHQRHRTLPPQVSLARLEAVSRAAQGLQVHEPRQRGEGCGRQQQRALREAPQAQQPLQLDQHQAVSILVEVVGHQQEPQGRACSARDRSFRGRWLVVQLLPLLAALRHAGVPAPLRTHLQPMPLCAVLTHATGWCHRYHLCWLNCALPLPTGTGILHRGAALRIGHRRSGTAAWKHVCMHASNEVKRPAVLPLQQTSPASEREPPGVAPFRMGGRRNVGRDGEKRHRDKYRHYRARARGHSVALLADKPHTPQFGSRLEPYN